MPALQIRRGPDTLPGRPVQECRKLETRVESASDVCIVRVHGRLDFGSSASFQQELEQLISARPRGCIIDCAGLEYVSSAGLRVFLVAARAAKAQGIGFAACALEPVVREVFDISGFNRIIDIRSTVDAALTSLAAPRP
jgi:anti-sigma B factor antagonist